MSTDFRKVLVKDSRIGNLTDSIDYAVYKGGQQVTGAKFMATSQSNSSHVYHIQVPSETTVIDRMIIWETTITLKISFSGNNASGGAAKTLDDYGAGTALAPFPGHQLISTLSATINNNTVSINTRDVLPQLLRLLDIHELQKYNGFTPTTPDYYGEYFSGVSLNPLSSNSSSDIYNQGRGSFPVEIANDIGFANAVADVANAAAWTPVYMRFTVREPLLLSPFIFGGRNQSNNAGIYGVSNMTINMNMGQPNRILRSIYEYGVELVSFTNSSLNMKFLTCHPSDLLSARCATPYYELPRYIFNYTSPGPDWGAGATVASAAIKPQPGVGRFTFSSVSLNAIPDKLIIVARKPLGEQKSDDPDCFFPITGISINFNNTSGVLSSMSQHDLYLMSKENGSNQTWGEFCGVQNVGAALGASAAGKSDMWRRTSGSVLVLQFGKDIQLIEDYYAPGSIGQFVLNFSISCENYGAASNVELVCITMNSGVFITERGSSSVFTAILSKQDVLDASSQDHHSDSDIRRLVGGGFLDSLKTTIGSINPARILKTIKDYAPLVKQGLRMSGNDTAHKIANTMESVGLGYSGAGSTTGGSSKLLKRLK